MNEKLFSTIYEAYFDQKDVSIFEHFLKPRLEAIEEGYAEVTMTVKEEHLNLQRIIHGGVLASVADLTMGVACISLNKSIVTSEISMSFIRSVKEGKQIRAKATVDHNGKSLMRTSCHIYDEEGHLLLKAIGSFFILGTLELMKSHNKGCIL